MRGSDIAVVLFLVSGFVPVAAFAQQTTPDASQSAQDQIRQTQQQHPDQAQTPNSQPGQMQQPSGQAQTQSTQVEPPHTPQQTDQLHNQERRNAENTRINRNWTAEQADESMKQTERMRQQQAEERMILERLRQRRMAEENEDHQTTGQRDGDEIYLGPRYGSADRSEGRYYSQARPYPRVKTCIEYANGDEFCRYRN